MSRVASRPPSRSPGAVKSWSARGSSRRRRRRHDAPVFNAVRTTQARGAGWRRPSPRRPGFGERLGDLVFGQLRAADDCHHRPQAGLPAGPEELRELRLLVAHTPLTPPPRSAYLRAEYLPGTRTRSSADSLTSSAQDMRGLADVGHPREPKRRRVSIHAREQHPPGLRAAYRRPEHVHVEVAGRRVGIAEDFPARADQSVPVRLAPLAHRVMGVADLGDRAGVGCSGDEPVVRYLSSRIGLMYLANWSSRGPPTRCT